MTLSTDWEVEQTWGSHQPLLQAVLEVLKPNSALECGCGNFSTPRLHSHVKELITVEHDQPWAQKIMKRFPHDPPLHSWVVHPISANNSTPIEDMDQGAVKGLVKFYQDLAKQIKSVDLLFVDTYRCARVIAVEALLPKARWIILHDLEPASIPWYGWDHLEPRMSVKGMFCYYHRPEGKIAQTHQIPWTFLFTKGCLSEEQFSQMNVVVKRESFRLWTQEVGLDG
jgi:hypothetical protein